MRFRKFRPLSKNTIPVFLAVADGFVSWPRIIKKEIHTGGHARRPIIKHPPNQRKGVIERGKHNPTIQYTNEETMFTRYT